MNRSIYSKYKDDSKYGRGYDNKNRGGEVVKGVTGDIHIEGGVESEIMKTHGPEGEHILARRNGYESFDDVPINPVTGNKEYHSKWYPHTHMFDDAFDKVGDWFEDTFGGASEWMGDAYTTFDNLIGGWLPGGGDFGGVLNPENWEEQWGIVDKYTSDMLQKAFKIGEYDPDVIKEKERNKELRELLGEQTASAIEGSEQMAGFIQDKMQQDLKGLDLDLEGLGIDEQGLDQDTITVQRGMKNQAAQVQDAERATGLMTDDTSMIEDIEYGGTAEIANIGRSRQKIGIGREKIGIGKDTVRTQADIDIAQNRLSTQQALASMLSDYMTATGETLPDDQLQDFMDFIQDNDDANMWEEYNFS